MEEIWKDIVIEKNGIIYDYTSLYQVSNLGRVRSLDRINVKGSKIKGKTLKPKRDKKGYLFVSLSKDGKVKNFTIHRLVATAFIPNPENLPIVNHKSEIKHDNCVDNLEWCTQKYNVNYGTCQEKRVKKISKALRGKMVGAKNPMAKKVICLETKQVFNCIREAEDWCGKKGIGSCCRGITNKCGSYKWQYYDDYKRQLRMNTDINNSKQLAA